MALGATQTASVATSANLVLVIIMKFLLKSAQFQRLSSSAKVLPANHSPLKLTLRPKIVV